MFAIVQSGLQSGLVGLLTSKIWPSPVPWMNCVKVVRPSVLSMDFVDWVRIAIDCSPSCPRFFWNSPSEHRSRMGCQDTVQSSPRLGTEGLDGTMANTDWISVDRYIRVVEVFGGIVCHSTLWGLRSPSSPVLVAGGLPVVGSPSGQQYKSLPDTSQSSLHRAMLKTM